MNGKLSKYLQNTKLNVVVSYSCLHHGTYGWRFQSLLSIPSRLLKMESCICLEDNLEKLSEQN